MLARIARTLSASADELLGLGAAPRLGTSKPCLRILRRPNQAGSLPSAKRKASLQTIAALLRVQD
jgi:hypothetical protein